jgi:hypothetical protein
MDMVNRSQRRGNAHGSKSKWGDRTERYDATNQSEDDYVDGLRERWDSVEALGVTEYENSGIAKVKNGPYHMTIYSLEKWMSRPDAAERSHGGDPVGMFGVGVYLDKVCSTLINHFTKIAKEGDPEGLLSLGVEATFLKAAGRITRHG